MIGWPLSSSRSSPDQLRAQSYDDDWTIAQVLSHLGSGAEIGELKPVRRADRDR